MCVARAVRLLGSTCVRRCFKTNPEATTCYKIWHHRSKHQLTMTEDDVKAIWRSADAVCFDVDSTVCRDEGIDELAAFMDVGKEVAQITNQAMDGKMVFKEALAVRLNVIRPSRQNITQFITEHPPQLTDGIRELVKILQGRGTPIYLISGGFHSIVETAAEALNIPKQNVFANKLTFYYNGEYAGFDEKEANCQPKGKCKVIQMLKDKYGYQKLVHIGDGATDMEASPPADAFIGFGGNQVRDKVRLGSKWYVVCFQELIDELHRKHIKS